MYYIVLGNKNLQGTLPVRVFKHRSFLSWAKKEKISDKQLSVAVKEMKAGLYHADLGAGLYKKRVAMQGQGKRTSYRTLLAYQNNFRLIFIYGFAKHDKLNINNREKTLLKKLATYLLNIDSVEINRLIKDKVLSEIKNER